MSAAGAYYGRERFDPGLILAQIVVLQAAFYASFTLLLLLFDSALHVSARVSAQMFDHRAVTLREFGGWVTACALVCAAGGPTALAYVVLVGRARRCLDFAVTIFAAHGIATTCHSGVPTSPAWWAVVLAALAMLAVVGEALCLRKELREIEVAKEVALDEDPLVEPDTV